MKKGENKDNLIDFDIQQILHKNHEVAYQKYQKKCKKQRRNKKILQIIITLLILVAIFLLGMWNKRLEDTFLKGCMNKGYSKNYCISKL